MTIQRGSCALMRGRLRRTTKPSVSHGGSTSCIRGRSVLSCTPNSSSITMSTLRSLQPDALDPARDTYHHAVAECEAQLDLAEQAGLLLKAGAGDGLDVAPDHRLCGDVNRIVLRNSDLLTAILRCIL